VDSVRSHNPNEKQEDDQIYYEKYAEKGTEWGDEYLAPLGLSTVIG